jgi:predicted Zn-dependent protease
METRMNKCLVVLLSFLNLTLASAASLELPRFLPAYYSPAFVVGMKNLDLIQQTEANGVEQAQYSAKDGLLELSVENMKCDAPRCGAIFDNVIYNLSDQIKSNSGRFLELSDSEAHVEIVTNKIKQQIFVYTLPSSIQVWIYTTPDIDMSQISPKSDLIHRFINRQIYEESLAAGNIEMGHWGKRIHEYAVQLLNDGKKAEGLNVLKNLLATSSFDYEAHLDVVKYTDDSSAAENSAKTVFKNAENKKLIDQAAKYLGKQLADINSIPLLDANQTGLQLILIPLPPCNPWLLDDAAATFRQITDIPVKIRRLKDDWKWASEDRIARERYIQGTLVRLKDKNIDFNGWTKDRYIKEMRSTIDSNETYSNNALLKYRINTIINKITEEPGQYSLDPYLDRFCDILAPYRSDDNRTMYVGITEADIYSGDNNFVFSVAKITDKYHASILSYHMMLGATLNAEYDSRQRLTDRIAKELVPASLKQLNIPRSTDPTCPYSYANGVERLDQKTLKLSDQVKEALAKLREPANTSTAK